MSYDLRIYTVKKQNVEDLQKKFSIIIEEDGGFILPLNKNQIVVSSEIQVEGEDIPIQVSREFPGLQYLIECNLVPYTDNKKAISELMKLGKAIAQNGYGVIENPQTDEIILPSGLKRVQTIEKTERFSIVELSWWFNNGNLLEPDNLKRLLIEIERTIPEVLPRRYGLYEPPKEKFLDLEKFEEFLIQNANDSIVWYPSKPIVFVNLRIPPVIGPTKRGYRFGSFSISIDSAVLSMPGWSITINRLFKNISQIIRPFYGDINIVDNYIRTRTGALIDGQTGSHPIVSWWWNGIPRKPGIALVIGNPLLEYVNVERDHISLSNACKVIFDTKSNETVEIYEGIVIPEELFQPTSKSKTIAFTGFNGRYPEIWPFEGPRAD